MAFHATKRPYQPKNRHNTTLDAVGPVSRGSETCGLRSGRERREKSCNGFVLSIQRPEYHERASAGGENKKPSNVTAPLILAPAYGTATAVVENVTNHLAIKVEERGYLSLPRDHSSSEPECSARKYNYSSPFPPCPNGSSTSYSTHGIRSTMETATVPVPAIAGSTHDPLSSLPLAEMPSIASSASPIVVPRIPDEIDSTAASPAITTTSDCLAPPSVSPLPPSIHTPNGDPMTTAIPQVMKAKAVTIKSQAGMNGGRWTEQEHQSFLAGLRLYGREWKKVASKIKTRTSAQIRSHAQKYFAKLARDDETRKLGGTGTGGLLSHVTGPDGGASLYGYMSDDGSSTTAGNISGDEGNDDTDSNTSHPHRASSTVVPALTTPSHRTILPVHPFPSPILGPPTAGLSINSLFNPRTAPLIVSAPANNNKKRSRPSSMAVPPPSCASTSFKQRKCAAGDESFHRLPSPEELVETVSPTVRQRLSSLIEAEISALQVLSCITWLQQQHQQGDLKVQLQPPPPQSAASTNSPSTSVFPAASLVFAAERSPSIF